MSETSGYNSDKTRNSGIEGLPSVGGERSADVSGLFERVLKTFSAPQDAFSGLANKWEWLIVALIVSVIGLGSWSIQSTYLMPNMLKDALKNIENFKDQMPEARYKEVRTQIKDGIEGNMKFTPKTSAIGVGAGVVMVVLIGLIAWGSGNFILGGKAPFWKILMVIAMAGFVGLVGEYARAGLMVMKGSSYVYLGLGILRPANDGSFIHYLLRQIELTTIWRLAVTCVGLGAVYKMSASKFAYVLTPIWLLFIAAVAGANLFTGGTIVY
ncbi:MAG: hypothetical protein IIB00_01255 [candidate division Zixibacteria bacterium]|nr:hypothetical protein [candidate division Zixibacteria bacterium]